MERPSAEEIERIRNKPVPQKEAFERAVLLHEIDWQAARILALEAALSRASRRIRELWLEMEAANFSEVPQPGREER